jgi:hypothetical protein
MKNIILASCLALCASCVTSGDLARIEDAQGQYQLQVQSALSDLKADTITPEQADARIHTAQTDLKSEISATIEAVKQRTDAVATAATKIPTDPMSLITYIAGLGVAVAGSSKLAAKKVNAERDLNRKLRGEPVDVKPPPA